MKAKNLVFVAVFLTVCLPSSAQQCSDALTNRESQVQYLRGVQYGWENASGVLLTEFKRHMPADEASPVDETWLNSYVLPEGVSWPELMEQVEAECHSSPSMSLLIVAHRVSFRTRKAKNPGDNSDRDRMRDLTSVRCRDMSTLGESFFRGYQDGYSALIESELRIMSKAADDPVMEKSSALLANTEKEQASAAANRQGILSFCNQGNNRDMPLVLAFISPAQSVAHETPVAKAEGEWQTGILADTTDEKGTRLIGSFHDSHGWLIEKRDDATYYEIDSGSLRYIAKRTLTRRRDKQLRVTINAQVRFRVTGDSLYLLAEDGKEHKLSLEKKILK